MVIGGGGKKERVGSRLKGQKCIENLRLKEVEIVAMESKSIGEAGVEAK